MITDYQYRRDTSASKAHDPFSPFPLVGRSWILILVSVTSKNDTINLLVDGCVDDLIQGLQEIVYTQGEAAGRIAPAMGCYVDVGICKMKDSGHFSIRDAIPIRDRILFIIHQKSSC
jgi:hypothetical protein